MIWTTAPCRAFAREWSASNATSAGMSASACGAWSRANPPPSSSTACWSGRGKRPRPGGTPSPPPRATKARRRLPTGSTSPVSSRGARRRSSDARGSAHRPVDEVVRLSGLTGRHDDVVMGREPAHGVRGPGIAGEAKRLTAAAAPVLLLPPERTRAARLLHPLGPAESRERVRFMPDPVERAIADVGELEVGNRRRRLTRKRVAVRGDDHRGASPATHARLREVLVIVRQDPEDSDPRADAVAEPLDRLLTALELLARGGKRLLVHHRPAVVLRVRELEPLGVELLGQPQDLLDAVQVLPMQNAVDGQREPEVARRARRPDLLLEGPVARDPVVLPRIRALDRDLNVVQSRLFQPFGALAREQRGPGDERGIQAGVAPRGAPGQKRGGPGDGRGIRAGAAPRGDQLVGVATEHWPPAGQGELEDAERARLVEDTLPVLALELGAVAVGADVERIRAVRAAQGTAIRQLRNEGVGPRRRHRSPARARSWRRPARARRPPRSCRRSAPTERRRSHRAFARRTVRGSAPPSRSNGPRPPESRARARR